MKVIALVKQVPDTKDQRFTDQHTAVRDGIDLICNPYDEYSVEEAVRLKERFTAETVALSMGKPSALDLLKFAISVGIDKGVLVSDPALAGSDLLSSSRILSKAIEKLNPFDLILVGKQSSDGENGVLGFAIAEFLGITSVADVKKIVKIENGTAVVEKSAGQGYYEIQVQLPALMSVVKEINEPRLPSLRGKMASKSAQIPVWTIKDLGLNVDEFGVKGARTRVETVLDPEKKQGVKIFNGTVDEAVESLVQELISKKII